MEKGILVSLKSKSVGSTEKKSRTVSCHVCNNEMKIENGTIIFDAKWFHPKCWNSYKKGGSTC